MNCAPSWRAPTDPRRCYLPPMSSPFIVLISGPPCSGKSTLGAALSERLGLPLVSMDLVKSSIALGMSGRGVDGRPERASDAIREMGGLAGQRAFDLTYDLIRRCLASGVSLIAEKAWQRGKSEPDLLAAVGDARAVQVHLTVPLEVAVRRGEGRPSRPGLVNMDEVARQVEEGRLTWDAFEPLDLGVPLLSLATDAAVDLAAVEAFVWENTTT